MNRGLLFSCALLVAGACADARAVEGRTAFLGAETGASRVDVDVAELGSDSDVDRTLLLRGGFYFTPHFAVEAFTTNLYDVSEDGYTAELDGRGVGLVARRNFGADNNGFYIIGRAGMFRAKGSASEVEVGSISGSSSKPYVGLGLGYDFNRHVGLGLNTTWYKADFEGLAVDVRTVTAGVEVRF